MFLRIENPVSVVPSMEILRTLGASSSRGTEAIGQFGSGFPYSLALLARKWMLGGLKICLGKDVYTFTTKATSSKTSRGDDFDIHEIILKKQNGGTCNLNISTEFGALDWRETDIALREFISNAIDGSPMPHDVKLEFVEENKCRAKEGTIRVYVEATDDVREYVDDVRKHFLCLSPTYNPDRQILQNRDGGPCMMYRKGVKVGSFGQQSLFHYNINDLSLKESRIVDSYHAREKAATAILNADVSTIVQYLQMWDSPTDYWEKDLNTYDFDVRYAKENVKENWSAAYKAMFGDTVLCETNQIAHIVRSKGKTARVFPDKLASVLKQIPTVVQSSQVLSQDEVNGRDVSDATSDVQTCLDRVWGFLTDNQMTNSKSKPKAHCFNEITKQEGARLGFYRNNEVYIHRDIAQTSPMLMQTMIEEVSHHVTGASDCTRDFQDFAFRLACLAMSYIL